MGSLRQVLQEEGFPNSVVFGDGTLAAQVVEALTSAGVKVVGVFVANENGPLPYAKRAAESRGINVYPHPEPEPEPHHEYNTDIQAEVSETSSSSEEDEDERKPAVETPEEPDDLEERIATARAAAQKQLEYAAKKEQVEGALATQVRALEVDLIVSCFPVYGIPDEVVGIPSLGCIGCFPSLLPKHAGTSPVQWTIIQGDTVTGATWYRQVPSQLVDHSLILSQRSAPTTPDDTAASLLTERIIPAARRGLEEAIIKVLRGERGERQVWLDADRLPGEPHGPQPLLADEHVVINWNSSAHIISGLIRGADPFPGAIAQVGTVLCRVFGRVILPLLDQGTDVQQPGTVHRIGPDGIAITTGTFPVVISHVQPIYDVQDLGRRRLPADRFASLTGLTLGAQLPQAQAPETDSMLLL